MKKVTCFLLLLSFVLSADTLFLKNSVVKGVFFNYSQYKVYFQNWDEDKAVGYDPVKIEKLELDKGLEVQVTLSSSPRSPRPAILKGYDKTRFTLEIDGRERVEHYRKVLKIENSVDEKDFFARRKAALGEGEAYKTVTDMIEAGKTTVIHFYLDDGEGIGKYGELLQQLCKESNGNAVYKKVLVSGPNDRLYKKYKLETLPQFWLFSTKGGVIAKLTAECSEQELKEAFQRARK